MTKILKSIFVLLQPEDLFTSKNKTNQTRKFRVPHILARASIEVLKLSYLVFPFPCWVSLRTSLDTPLTGGIFARTSGDPAARWRQKRATVDNIFPRCGFVNDTESTSRGHRHLPETREGAPDQGSAVAGSLPVSAETGLCGAIGAGKGIGIGSAGVVSSTGPEKRLKYPVNFAFKVVTKAVVTRSACFTGGARCWI